MKKTFLALSLLIFLNSCGQTVTNDLRLTVSKEDLWISLEKVGLTKENINQEIRKELKDDNKDRI